MKLLSSARLVALTGTLALMFMACGGDETPKTTTQTPGQTQASKANVASERFALTDINGRTRVWSEFIGKPFAINFWATWCGPCRMEIPVLKKLYAEYKPRGFEIIGISVDRDQRQVIPYIKQMGVPWVVLYTNAEVIEEFKLGRGIPYTIFFDAQGNETGRVTGAQSEEVFRQELAKLFAAS